MENNNRAEDIKRYDHLMQKRFDGLQQELQKGMEVYVPTRKAAEFLEKRGFKVCYQCVDSPPEQEPIQVIIGTDIMIIFNKMGLKKWESNRKCPHGVFPKMRGEAILTAGERRIAIELFVTVQQRRGYYESLFREYQADPSINHVLCFVPLQWVQEYFLPMTRRYDKIHFIHMGDFFLNRVNAHMDHSSKQNLRLRDILGGSYNTRHNLFSWFKGVFNKREQNDQSPQEFSNN